MSFEGYYRFLCERGHRSEYDVYSTEIGKCEEWDAGGCVMNWGKIVNAPAEIGWSGAI